LGKLQEELGVTAISFVHVGAVARGGVGVATKATLVVEEKTAFTLLLVLLLFLCLYYSYNTNNTNSIQ
jgi:hypothetical protein